MASDPPNPPAGAAGADAVPAGLADSNVPVAATTADAAGAWPRTEALRAQIAERLAAWPVRAAEAAAAELTDGPSAAQGLRQAAVALAISDEGHGAQVHGLRRLPQWSRQAALILTRRALHLKRHAGQWALPGGRMDPGETAEQTALRELHEEVGLALPPQAVLGRLDTFVTRSGFAITPVVVWAGAAPELQPDANEVASVHRIPFGEFLRADSPLLEPLAGSAHPVLKLRVGRSWIAAPTAALIYQFREVCLLDRAVRVGHYEQPRFAWR